jgi:hypothetical protein
VEYGQNRQGKFGTEDSARKSLTSGTDRILAYYNRWGGGISKCTTSSGEEQDQLGPNVQHNEEGNIPDTGKALTGVEDTDLNVCI